MHRILAIRCVHCLLLTSLPCEDAAHNADGGQEVIICGRSSPTSSHYADDLSTVAPIAPLLFTKGKKCKRLTKNVEKSASSFICRRDELVIGDLELVPLYWNNNTSFMEHMCLIRVVCFFIFVWLLIIQERHSKIVCENLFCKCV